MKTIFRYLKLYGTSIKRSMMSRMVYKKNTFIAISAFIFSNICSILSIYFIVNSIPNLNVNGQSWDIWQIGMIYGFAMLPVAIDHLFSDELWLVSYRRVVDGSLDPLMLRPVPSLFMVLAETFQPEGFGELIVGITMLIICGLQPSVELAINFGTILLIIVSTIFGAVIITSFKIMIASLAFRMKRSGPILQVIYNFIAYTKYPIGIYHPFVRAILTFIFPFALFISFPMEILMGFNNFNPYLLSLIIIGVAIILLTLSILIWRINEKKYESTGN